MMLHMGLDALSGGPSVDIGRPRNTFRVFLDHRKLNYAGLRGYDGDRQNEV